MSDGHAMRVLYVCTELFPLLKTGGLGDVSGALPPALRIMCESPSLIPSSAYTLCVVVNHHPAK